MHRSRVFPCNRDQIRPILHATFDIDQRSIERSRDFDNNVIDQVTKQTNERSNERPESEGSSGKSARAKPKQRLIHQRLLPSLDFHTHIPYIQTNVNGVSRRMSRCTVIKIIRWAGDQAWPSRAMYTALRFTIEWKISFGRFPRQTSLGPILWTRGRQQESASFEKRRRSSPIPLGEQRA